MFLCSTEVSLVVSLVVNPSEVMRKGTAVRLQEYFVVSATILASRFVSRAKTLINNYKTWLWLAG